jgi:hypothetical protein
MTTPAITQLRADRQRLAHPSSNRVSCITLFRPSRSLTDADGQIRTSADAAAPVLAFGRCLRLATFYEWRAKGRAPRCITLPNGSLRIRRSEYQRWLASREEAA